MKQPGREEPPAAAAPAVSGNGLERADRRMTAAVVSLSIAGVLAPIAVAWAAASSALLGRPLAASALLALLVLAPAAVALATALTGLRRVASLSADSGSEAEQAVLRILIVTLLFGHALALTSLGGAGVDCLPIAAAGLIAGWILLLSVILWPAAAPLRRYGAIVFDVVMLSAFLHFGGSAVAGWYPLYLVATFYAGLRFGLGALAAAGSLSMIGFAAVVASTDLGGQQPSLAAGLVLGLGVLPAFFGGAIRALTAASEVEAERQRTLRLIADTLRAPAVNTRAGRAAPSPIGDILDFAALEAGSFAPPVETFDLRALITNSLAPLRAKATENGVALRWRVDPRLPYRLRGQAQTFARIIRSLVDQAIAQAATTRISVDAADGDTHRIGVRVRVDALGGRGEVGVVPGEVPLPLRLVQRLVALAGGAFAMEHAAGSRLRLTVTLPLAVEAGTAAPILDLGYRPVVIATADDDLARSIAEPLAVWNGDPRWPGDIDAALADLARLGDATGPIVIVDGRDRLLSALSLAHQAAKRGSEAFVLLIAEEAQLASVLDLDEGELDGFIPAPLTERLLANALHALPLPPITHAGEPRPVPEARAAPERRAVPEPRLTPAPRPAAARDPAAAGGQGGGDRITPIAVHPKYLPEAAAALDPRVIEGLRALGGDAGFLREIVESFCADAGQILEGIQHAAAAADATQFSRGVVALHRAAGHLGGLQLCELATSLQRVSASELRQHGAVHVQRLAAEIERFAGALTEYLPVAEARGY